MTVSLFVSIHVSFDSIGFYDSIGLSGNFIENKYRRCKTA